MKEAAILLGKALVKAARILAESHLAETRFAEHMGYRHEEAKDLLFKTVSQLYDARIQEILQEEGETAPVPNKDFQDARRYRFLRERLEIYPERLSTVVRMAAFRTEDPQPGAAVDVRLDALLDGAMQKQSALGKPLPPEDHSLPKEGFFR